VDEGKEKKEKRQHGKTLEKKERKGCGEVQLGGKEKREKKNGGK